MKIIRDTREKVGYWDFSFHGYEQSVSCLKTGDYSISGYEDILCIERKKSTGEVARNIGVDRVRFEAELLRMKDFKYKYLIFEFSVAQLLFYPKGSGLSREAMKKTRISPQFILKKLDEYEKEYGIEIIYAGNKEGAMEVAMEIFNEVINES